MASACYASGTSATLHSRHRDLYLFPPVAFVSNLRGICFPRCTRTVAVAGDANLPLSPIVSGQTSPGSGTFFACYVPEADFYKVEAVLRPWRINQVSSALLKMGIRGITVYDVRGFGAQGGMTERQAGSEFSEDDFVSKVKMEIVVCKDQVEEVIDKIVEVSRTGEIGDGKIFLSPVTDVIRIRTGERGEKAERMMGGRADMFSAGNSA